MIARIKKHKWFAINAVLVYLAIIGLYALTGHLMDMGVLEGALTGLATPPGALLVILITAPIYIAINKTMYALLGQKDPGFRRPDKRDNHER